MCRSIAFGSDAGRRDCARSELWRDTTRRRPGQEESFKRLEDNKPAQQ